MLGFRRINKVIHRDLGYFFTGMTLIYVISGIALNHKDLWNPGYIITRNSKTLSADVPVLTNPEEAAIFLVKNFSYENTYKSYYFPDKQTFKIFIDHGTLEYNLITKNLIIELLHKRPFFGEIDYLHRNPKQLWTWISDFYCISMIIITLSGLIILKGKDGFIYRGLFFVIAGIVIPITFLIFYYYQ